METASADQPEPKQTSSFFRLLPVTFIIIILSACGNRKWQKPEYPVAVVDSAAIQQQEKQRQDSLQKISIARKKIYLTFDDGPNKGTRNVLQAVKEDNIPASFFIVGEHVFDSPKQTQTWELLKVDSTIELCNHSYTHAHNRYTSFYNKPSMVVADFQRSRQALQFSNNIARMPGRNAWRIDTIDHTDIYQSSAAIDSLHAAGFNIMGWDIEWMFDHKTRLQRASFARTIEQKFRIGWGNRLEQQLAAYLPVVVDAGGTIGEAIEPARHQDPAQAQGPPRHPRRRPGAAPGAAHGGRKGLDGTQPERCIDLLGREIAAKKVETNE